MKYEDICLKGYASVADLNESLEAYTDFYDHSRNHQALGYLTPYEVDTASRSKSVRGRRPSAKKWSFWVYCGSSEKEMHRVRLSPQDFLRHFAGVQVVIDHELEVGVPTLIGPLAEWLRQRPFSQREILGHLRDASENPAAPAALNHTAATTRTTVGQSLT
ncbi:MAG: integrase core domain-containing protein [Pirellulales bacterium]